MTTDEIDRARGNFGVFETVTPAQNSALNYLIKRLQESFQIPSNEIFAHPTVSAKNVTEGSTAKWPGR